MKNLIKKRGLRLNRIVGTNEKKRNKSHKNKNTKRQTNTESNNKWNIESTLQKSQESSGKGI